MKDTCHLSHLSSLSLKEQEQGPGWRCEELSQADISFLHQCQAVRDSLEEQEEITDLLLEKLVKKAWNIYQESDKMLIPPSDLCPQSSELLRQLSLQTVADVTVLDPLDLSSLVSPLHLQRTEDFYYIDGWLKDISLHGLSDIQLDTVSVTRNNNLSAINIRTVTGLDMVTFKGPVESLLIIIS